MKKLFAMLLVLCLVFCMAAAEAEDIQTISGKLVELKVPAGWEMEITQDANHAFVAFPILPDGQQAHIDIVKYDSRIYPGCATQYEFFERKYGKLNNITISEGYADMMPDKQPLIIGDSHDGTLHLLHRYSDIVMYMTYPAADNALDVLLPVFTSVTTPAIEADREANKDVTVSAETKVVQDAGVIEHRVQVGNLSFKVLMHQTASEPVQETAGLVSCTLYSNEDNTRILVMDYEKAGVQRNVFYADEQLDNLFCMARLLGYDAETAFDICSDAERCYGGLNDGENIMIYGEGALGLGAHYYGGVGFIVEVQCMGESIPENLGYDLVYTTATSVRMENASGE